ncbi:potassium channel subfamily t member 1 [Plakobranchus ocellatus]|uniref:Potassium channel subfamily t member 1 n=1 Tax=Plakobranchus ocellatus TaxID=259542 RepID=A0AAV4CB94_9GAST|nr:potassium channel subfamily t member 1 [Plakobranchus ocellatus]
MTNRVNICEGVKEASSISTVTHGVQPNALSVFYFICLRVTSPVPHISDQSSPAHRCVQSNALSVLYFICLRVTSPVPHIVVSGPTPEMERRRWRVGSEDGSVYNANDLFNLESDSDGDSSDNPMQVDTPDKSAPVKYYTNELSIRGRLRKFFIRNSTTRVACTFFDLALKSVICALYVLRVIMDDVSSYECAGSPCGSENETETDDGSDGINWYVILWVERSLTLWLVEVTLAGISLAKALLLVYISTKSNKIQRRGVESSQSLGSRGVGSVDGKRGSLAQNKAGEVMAACRTHGGQRDQSKLSCSPGTTPGDTAPTAGQP